jgi:hypothetical protein
MTKKFRYTKAIREIEEKIEKSNSTLCDIYCRKCIQIINNNIIETEEINIEDKRIKQLLHELQMYRMFCRKNKDAYMVLSEIRKTVKELWGIK